MALAALLLLAAQAAPDDFWSRRPLARPAPPAVRDEAWVRTSVDRFILSTLEGTGLAPSPPASKSDLLRRAAFDLHGLPPTPDDRAAFLADDSPEAFDRAVDRLLASPRYGERWGRHWLDVARYADTHGYDKDKRRPNAWPYRDYVIRAFNGDKPYARFVREQVAGDILFPGDPDGVIATGFLAAGPWDFVGQTELREGTVDKEITRSLDRDEMVAAVASVFLSATVHCARCHDHKYDPIPQRDYYRLQAVFAGVERGDRPYRADPEIDGRRKAFEERLAELNRKRKDLERPLRRQRPPRLDEAEREIALLVQGYAPSETNGWHSAISDKPDVVKWVQVDLGRSLSLEEIRLVPAKPVDWPDTPGFGFPVRFRIELSDDADFARPFAVADHTEADFPNPGDMPVVHPVTRAARYIRVTAVRLWHRKQDWVFALAELQAVSEGRVLPAAVASLDSIEAGRWSRRHLVDGAGSRHKLPDLATQRIHEKLLAEQRELTRIPPETAAEIEKIAAETRSVTDSMKALPPPEVVYAVLPRAPRPIHLLKRGDVQKPGDEVGPGALGVEFVRTEDEGARRAALAEWIVDASNVLAWRSIVNRIWHHHFGRGLVDSPNDFGRHGGRPSHPALLDWLAVEFRDGGGSFKKLHKLIMTSAVYRQGSGSRPGAGRVDADNRLLWRMNRRRLDAESLRDSVLAVSGAMEFRMGGPGYDLFHFKDDHSPHYDYVRFNAVERPETHRRTIYRFTVRSVANPFLEALDCPDPSLSSPARAATNTALQALAVLNDPLVLRESQRLAALLEREPDPVGTAFGRVLGRAPGAEERRAVAEYAKKHGLANGVRLLFNTNEFSFVD